MEHFFYLQNTVTSIFGFDCERMNTNILDTTKCFVYNFNPSEIFTDPTKVSVLIGDNRSVTNKDSEIKTVVEIDIPETNNVDELMDIYVVTDKEGEDSWMELEHVKHITIMTHGKSLGDKIIGGLYQTSKNLVDKNKVSFNNIMDDES